jgi:hypothetical protein
MKSTRTTRARVKSKPLATKKATTKKATTKKATSAMVAASRPSPTARAEYEALMAEVEDAELDSQRGWDRLWEATRTIVRKKLFLLEEDTPTAQAWVRKHTGELYRTAQRNMTVAALSSPSEQRKFKVTKIGLAYAIDEAQREARAKKNKQEYVAPETPPKLDLASLRYDVERNGKQTRLSLTAVTSEELRAILRAIRRGSKSAKPTYGPLAKRLVERLSEDRKLDHVRVVEREGALSLSGIRAEHLRALGALLVSLSRS